MYLKMFCLQCLKRSIRKCSIGRLHLLCLLVLRARFLTPEIFTFGEFGVEVQKYKNTNTILVASTLSMECSQCLKCLQFSNLLLLRIYQLIVIFSDCTKDIFMGTNIFLNILLTMQEQLPISLGILISLRSCKHMLLRWQLSV